MPVDRLGYCYAFNIQCCVGLRLPASLSPHKCSVRLKGQISLERKKQNSFIVTDLPQVKQQLWVRLKST